MTSEKANTNTGAKFEKLIEIMAALRGPNGCPWDKEQDAHSLKPMLVEETYEVLEAIDNGDADALAEELGDLLLHIVFQSQLARENRRFDAGDVVDRICAKLVRRHPHVFAGDSAATSAEVLRNWEAIKAQEKAEKSGGATPQQGSLLDGIPSQLPALHEAHRISAKAARAGFDWPDIEGVFAKLDEEVRELRAAMAESPESRQARMEDEVGDLFFVLVNIARTLAIDSESALKRANRKFKSRFQHMESRLAGRGENIEGTPLDELERLWQQAKAESGGMAESGNGRAVNIRVLSSIAEFRQCMDLQREGFRWENIDLMPVRFFVVSHQVGGLVLGAYDPDQRMIGFLSSIPGLRQGQPYWHSHMLAVTSEHRNSGVGAALKRAQREQALQQGIRLIEWTFDPLEAKNAYFNIEKLGVVVRRYHVNHYGETAQGAGRPFESDRLIAEWWIDSRRPDVGAEARRLVIPSDIQSIKTNDPGRFEDIQRRVRAAFIDNLADGYVAAAFERRGDEGSYIFIPGARIEDRIG